MASSGTWPRRSFVATSRCGRQEDFAAILLSQEVGPNASFDSNAIFGKERYRIGVGIFDQVLLWMTGARCGSLPNRRAMRTCRASGPAMRRETFLSDLYGFF